MIEIIALIFLCREIGRLAEQKGLRKNRWRLYTVLAWIAAELLGVIVGIMFFGQDNLFSVALVGLGFAITSYYLLKNSLSKLPDAMDDEINNIGNDL